MMVDEASMDLYISSRCILFSKLVKYCNNFVVPTTGTNISIHVASRPNAFLIREKVQLRWPHQEAILQPQHIVYSGLIKPSMLQS